MDRRTFLAAPAVLGAALPRLSAAAADPAATAWDDDLRTLGIWDGHVHVGTPGTTPERRMEALVRSADRMGVERLCIFMSPPWQNEPTPEQFRRSNDDVLAILREWGSRAFGFVYLNPSHLRASLDELERCVADGPMVGVKLWVGTRAHRAELDPVITRAKELQALVFQHTWIKQRGRGNLAQESTPMELAALSTRHPGVPMVCGHTGGDWTLGLRALRAHPELYADLGGVDPVAGEVEMAVRELGAERVLYGSDASGRSFASQIGRVLGADVPTAAKRLILRENLRRLLLPILHRKGFRT